MLDFLPDCLLACFSHLLADKATYYFEDGSVFYLGLHDDIALPNFILKVTVAYIFDMQAHSSLLLEASPEMIKEEVSLKIEKLPVVEFTLNRHIVVVSMFSKLHFSFLPDLSSRGSHAETSLDKLQPDFLLVFQINAFYFRFRELANVYQFIEVLSSR
jgi:hypothetical protein